MGKILTIKGMVYHFKLNNLKEAEECYLHGLEAKKKCRDLLG
jgi:tetratricopeptide (TPR) repeat protein